MKTQEIEQKYKDWARIIANMVYGYQGSDPKVIQKQIGLDNAAETLKQIILSESSFDSS